MACFDSSLLARFWSKVDKDGPIIRPELGPCWVWTAQLNNKGYGKCHPPRPRHEEYAHRFAWEIEHGSIPEAAWVLHRCDNPPCVRHHHLFLGNVKDNSMDSAAKFRVNTTKLTLEQIQLIRAQVRGRQSYGVTLRLAKEYGVHRSTIRRVAKRETFLLI